jgi:hypothetical protein
MVLDFIIPSNVRFNIEMPQNFTENVKNNTFSIIDTTGRALPNQQFVDIRNFNEGLAYATSAFIGINKKSVCFYINEWGEKSLMFQ